MLLFMSSTKPLISGYLIYVDIMNSLFIVSHHIIWLGRCSHWMNFFWAHITLSRATYSTGDQWGCSTLGLYVHACGLNLVFLLESFFPVPLFILSTLLTARNVTFFVSTLQSLRLFAVSLGTSYTHFMKSDGRPLLRLGTYDPSPRLSALSFMGFEQFSFLFVTVTVHYPKLLP